MANYYTEVTTAHGTSNRNMTGKIDAVRKAVLKRIKELNGYGGYVHIKTAKGWKLIGRIDLGGVDAKHSDDYTWFSYETTKLYPLNKNGTISKCIKW